MSYSPQGLPRESPRARIARACVLECSELSGMKARSAIKLTLLLAGLASSMYQLPKMLGMLEQAKAGNPLGNLGGASEAFKMLGQLQGLGQMSGGTQPAALDEPELRIFTPDAGTMSDAQRAEMLAAARRLRPRFEIDPNGNPVAGAPGGSNRSGSQADANHITIGGIDPALLQQIQSLSAAEEAIQQLIKGTPK